MAAATECVVQDQAKVSFGPSPFLLQHFTGHYRDISIHTAGHQIRNAKGMTADININNVDLHGSGDSKGTIGELDATITWTSDGIKETVQDSVPFVGGLVNSVSTNPGAGTIELSGALGLGSVTVKPQVAGSGLSLQVVKVTAMGATLPHETAQAALDTFTAGADQATIHWVFMPTACRSPMTVWWRTFRRATPRSRPPRPTPASPMCNGKIALMVNPRGPSGGDPSEGARSDADRPDPPTAAYRHAVSPGAAVGTTDSPYPGRPGRPQDPAYP